MELEPRVARHSETWAWPRKFSTTSIFRDQLVFLHTEIFDMISETERLTLRNRIESDVSSYTVSAVNFLESMKNLGFQAALSWFSILWNNMIRGEL